ncbi:MAG: hypothetical protein HN348_03925 [Proteobacteria bacterium]|nr:hypothetical protein [Pseudomonadota bacterium]
MLQALFIFVDEDFSSPIFAEPADDNLDSEVWDTIYTAVHEALEGDRRIDGTEEVMDFVVGWRVSVRTGLSFVAVVEDIKARALEAFLLALSRRYFDEVVDARHPDRHGVADVVVDVIPPWEE